MHVMGSVSPANESESFRDALGAVVDVLASSPPPPPSNPPAVVEGNPAPPPPPPPPPPPLLPLYLGLGNPVVTEKKKRRVRSFFWKTIPEEQVKGRSNLWTKGRGQQQQYQIDVRSVEELFGHNDCQSHAVATPIRGLKVRASVREISILDSKRGMNVGIFLKQFKRSNQTIIDDIRHGNSEHYGAEPLRELLKLLPDTEEVNKLRSFRGDTAKLSLADSFMYLLTQLPSYPVRIESMLLKEEFPSASESMKRDISTLHTAATELLSCEELHAVLHLVLQAGNILNAGGYSGNAAGFKLASLLSLADTKSNKPGMNLLHFVALEAQKKDQRLLEFSSRLKHVQSAARISMETMDAELHSLTSRTRSVEKSIQWDTELLMQLDTFLQRVVSCVCVLRVNRENLNSVVGELTDFFCEDALTFRLDECFNIVKDFCTKFNTAAKENIEREAKEKARRLRLRELEEKRHSWSGGEEVDGAFGMRCSSEADMASALSLHEEAGLQHSRSPLLANSTVVNSHNPLGRSVSMRRSRNSPSGSPSAATERQLSMLLGMTPPPEPKAGVGGGEAAPSPAHALWRLGSPASSPEAGPCRSSGVSPWMRPMSPGLALRLKHHTLLPAMPPQSPPTPQTPPPCAMPTSQTPPPTASNPTSKTCRSPTGTPAQPDAETTPSTSECNQPCWETSRTKQHDASSHTAVQTYDDNDSFRLSVTVERHTLVPELQVFDDVDTPGEELLRDVDSHDEIRQEDTEVVERDGEVEEEEEEDGGTGSQVSYRYKHCEPESNISSSTAPPSHREGERDVKGDGEEERSVFVWCVTSVCETEGERDDTHTPAHTLTQPEDTQAPVHTPTQPEDAHTPVHTPTQPEDTNTPVHTPAQPEDTHAPVHTPTQPEDAHTPVHTPSQPEDTNTHAHTPAQPEDTHAPAHTPKQPEDSPSTPHTPVNDTCQSPSRYREVVKDTSCIPANDAPSEPCLDGEQPIPVATQSLPALPSTNQTPAESTDEMPAPTTDAYEGTKQSTDENEEKEVSANEKSEFVTAPEHPTNETKQTEGFTSVRRETESPPLHLVNDKQESRTSSNENTASETSPKPSSKTLPSKCRPTAGVKPSTSSSATTPKPKSVRTLNSSENQGMRRVVPISRPSRAASSLGKRPTKPAGHLQSTSGSLSPLNANSPSIRRGEKTTSCPSSPWKSSVLKQDPSQVSSIQSPARDSGGQQQPLQKCPSVRKPVQKPQRASEEKMCRSTLRALAAQTGEGGGGGGGGGSVSAPATPSHKVARFAQNTASSSFRRTHAALASPTPPHEEAGSPKAATAASPFVRLGSLRHPSSRPPYSSSSSSSSVLPNSDEPSSSPLRSSQSIRVPPPLTPPHDSLAPPKGHSRNNSGSFSDKSALSRDSKTHKPTWR